jgi:hypothetical protein
LQASADKRFASGESVVFGAPTTVVTFLTVTGPAHIPVCMDQVLSFENALTDVSTSQGPVQANAPAGATVVNPRTRLTKSPALASFPMGSPHLMVLMLAGSYKTPIQLHNLYFKNMGATKRLTINPCLKTPTSFLS